MNSPVIPHVHMNIGSCFWVKKGQKYLISNGTKLQCFHNLASYMISRQPEVLHQRLYYSCESTEAADFCASCHPARCPHGEMNLSNYSLPNQAVLVPLLLQRYSTV